jgi:peptidoglycan/xylan/chitin deacetylase (PgdA/CDA1 family)
MSAGDGVAVSIPILCFHAVEEGPAPLCYPPAAFEHLVAELHELGCHSLTASEVADHIRDRRPFPRRAVAFTFDDGYASVHGDALGILGAAGFTGSVYPVSSYLGRVGSWDPAVKRADLRLLAPAQLRELRAAGWEVGGHTHTHPKLPAIGPERIRDELDRSSEVLAGLGVGPIRTFAYPYGLHDPASREVACGVYDACFAIGASKATAASPLDRVERIEASYLRGSWPVRHLHDRAGGAYLALRRGGRAVRTRLDR